MINRYREIKIIFPLLLLILIGIVFRQFWFNGKYPIPFNNLVLLHFPYTTGGWDIQPNLIFQGGLFGSDVYRQLIPWKHLAIEQLKKGELPLWNPYNLSGEPLLANIQVHLLYPITLLYFVFDFYQVWSIYIISTPIIATTGMYLFLREIKLKPFSATIGAIVFGFSMRSISWMVWGVVIHSGVWWPFMVWGYLKIRKMQPIGYFYLISAITLTLLGGYPRESIYSFLGFIIFLIIHQIHTREKIKIPSVKIYLPLIFICGSLVGLQFSQTFIFYQKSTLKQLGTQGNFLDNQMHLGHLMTFFAPDYFGNRVKENYWAEVFTSNDYMDTNLHMTGVGGIFIVLLLTQLLRLAIRNKSIPQVSLLEKTGFTLTIFGLLVALNNPISDFIGSIYIPTVTSGAAVGFNYFTVLGLSLLTGAGVERFWKKIEIIDILLVTIVYLFVLLSVFIVPRDFQTIVIRNLVIPLGIAGITWIILLINYFKNTSVVILISEFIVCFLLIFQIVYQTDQMIKFASKKIAYPQHKLINEIKNIAGYDRSIGLWDAEITTNLDTMLGLYSIEGYNPLNLIHYQELVTGSKYLGYPDKLVRSDADIDPDAVIGRDRLLELTSVKYVYDKVTDQSIKWEIQPSKFDPQRFELIYQEDKYKIYSHKLALERVSLFNDYLVIKDTKSRLEKLYNKEFDPKSQLILEKELKEVISKDASGSARIIEYTPNQVILDVDIKKGPMLLMLTDTYFPSWHAYIDKTELEIFKANQAFRAVIVPEGKHQLIFKIKLI